MDAGEILLSQARTQLGRQEIAVDTLRTRATAVFSASGVVAALFGPKVLAMGHGSAWPYVALAPLLAGAVATVIVLVPRHMTFTEQLDDWWGWLDQAEQAPDRDEALAIGLAENLDALWKLNQGPIERVANAYLVLCVAFGVQVAAWVTAALLV